MTEVFGSRFVELWRRQDGRIWFSFWEHSEETGQQNGEDDWNDGRKLNWR